MTCCRRRWLGELDGRSCPLDVDIVKFLAEAMRSIAHGEAEKVIHRLPILAVPKTGSSEEPVMRVPDPCPTAEERLIAFAEVERIQAEVLSLFDDDPIARDLVEGIFAGLDADELKQLTDLDQTGYESKRRLIRRRVDKAFPHGWTI